MHAQRVAHSVSGVGEETGRPPARKRPSDRMTSRPSNTMHQSRWTQRIKRRVRACRGWLIKGIGVRAHRIRSAENGWGCTDVETRDGSNEHSRSRPHEWQSETRGPQSVDRGLCLTVLSAVTQTRYLISQQGSTASMGAHKAAGITSPRPCAPGSRCHRATWQRGRQRVCAPRRRWRSVCRAGVRWLRPIAQWARGAGPA